MACWPAGSDGPWPVGPSNRTLHLSSSNWASSNGRISESHLHSVSICDRLCRECIDSGRRLDPAFNAKILDVRPLIEYRQGANLIVRPLTTTNSSFNENDPSNFLVSKKRKESAICDLSITSCDTSFKRPRSLV